LTEQIQGKPIKLRVVRLDIRQVPVARLDVVVRRKKDDKIKLKCRFSADAHLTGIIIYHHLSNNRQKSI